MPALKFLSQNNTPLAKAALSWLKQGPKTFDLAHHHLYLLQLAEHGLKAGATGEWPPRDRHSLQSQVERMFGWKPANAMAWLLSNPNGPDKQEQQTTLLQSLNEAKNPREAAAIVLSAIYSRQQADNPALQPAASELS